MPISLKCKLKKLNHNGSITDEECEDLLKKLDGHDKQIREDAIQEYKKKIEFEEKWLLLCKVFDPNVTIAFETLKSYAEQMQKGADNA